MGLLAKFLRGRAAEEVGEGDLEATERRYHRKPVFEWTWVHWLASVGVLAFFLALFLASLISLSGEKRFLHVLGHTLALSGFPTVCVLFWFWYRALHEEEESERTVPIPMPPVASGSQYREPILYKPYAPKQLEPPSALAPDVLIFVIRELWDQQQLSRRQVMRVRLPGGQKISRGMWERLIGGYRDGQGGEHPGLLAEAGLIVRTNDQSWQWREGLTLEEALKCFDWDTPQICGPKPPQDLGRAGRAGRVLGSGHSKPPGEGVLSWVHGWLERERRQNRLT